MEMIVQANKGQIFIPVSKHSVSLHLHAHHSESQVSFRALGRERSMLCSSDRVAVPQANALLSGTEAEGLERGENESFTGFMSYHTWTKCMEQHTHGSFSALHLAYGGG